MQTWLARRSVRRRAKRVRRIRANIALADEMRLYASMAVGGMGLLALGMIMAVGFDTVTTLAGIEIMLRQPLPVQGQPATWLALLPYRVGAALGSLVYRRPYREANDSSLVAISALRCLRL